MLGAIIGDIVGSRWEFNPTNNYNFELFSDKNSYTDDTICTIAVADALLHGSDDYGKYIHEWCRKYPHPMGGYGFSFAKWVNSDHPEHYGSYGNGAAMRVSPIGWWYETPHDLLEESKKSAACTHNHKLGIEGAQSVVMAVRDCRILRKDKKGKQLTQNDILISGIDHSASFYIEYPKTLSLNIEDYRNVFNETAQGTVPVALWIVAHSTSFEDAIRQAVSLGADADTLGAIVGSIAEALWGIPEWMKKKALSYLPEEMKDVVHEFHTRVNRLRKLSQRCEYYLFGDFNYVEEKNEGICDIEKGWAHSLAESYKNADKIKSDMANLYPMGEWQELAEDYDLPVSLIGYIVKRVLSSKHYSLEDVRQHLDKYYGNRKKQVAVKKSEEAKKQHFMAIMHWKLGLGDLNKLMSGGSPLPDKSKVATAKDWNILHMVSDENEKSTVDLDIPIPSTVMDILRLGHIPEVQEDHWFMYCGMCAFEAHFSKESETIYRIDRLTMAHFMVDFGVNGDEAGIMLFRYLITAESGLDAAGAWQDYLNAWNKLDAQYNK